MGRWVRPFRAPASEAVGTVSPFITGFEIRAHVLAGYPEGAIDLMEWMWGDFMLDDPPMTNSIYMEGFSKDGRIRYPLYKDVDQRFSYTHAWPSGPSSALTNYVVGLQVKGPRGRSWTLRPQPGKLDYISAGFDTSLGLLSATWRRRYGCVVGELKTTPGSQQTLVLQHTE